METVRSSALARLSGGDVFVLDELADGLSGVLRSMAGWVDGAGFRLGPAAWFVGVADGCGLD